MGKYIWRKVNIWFGKEATRGTAVAPDLRCPKASLDFEDQSEKVIDESSIGVIEDSFDGHVVKQRAEWNFECNVYANAIWYILLNLFGSVSTSGSTGEYTHEFSVDETNQHQSLTIGLADDTQDRQFPLAMIDSAEITAETWNFVTISSDFKSKKWNDASLTPSYSNDFALLWKHVQVYLADDLSGLDSASSIQATQVTLTINKNLEDVDVLGSVQPLDFCNTFFNIEWSMELLRDDATYKNIYMDGVKKAMRIEIVDNDTTLSTGHPTLTFDLANVIMTEYAKNQDNNALIRQTLTFRWLYSMNDNSMITAKLINSQSAY